MRITEQAYFGVFRDHPLVLPEHREHARVLLVQVDLLLQHAERAKIVLHENPVTRSLISGRGTGGWRLPNATIGAPNSAHKTGQAVDVYDPDGDLDEWILEDTQRLAQLGLYVEHPAATKGWSHLTTRAPRSGHRVFFP